MSFTFCEIQQLKYYYRLFSDVGNYQDLKTPDPYQETIDGSTSDSTFSESISSDSVLNQGEYSKRRVHLPQRTPPHQRKALKRKVSENDEFDRQVKIMAENVLESIKRREEERKTNDELSQENEEFRSKYEKLRESARFFKEQVEEKVLIVEQKSENAFKERDFYKNKYESLLKTSSEKDVEIMSLKNKLSTALARAESIEARHIALQQVMSKDPTDVAKSESVSFINEAYKRANLQTPAHVVDYGALPEATGN